MRKETHVLLAALAVILFAACTQVVETPDEAVTGGTVIDTTGDINEPLSDNETEDDFNEGIVETPEEPDEPQGNFVSIEPDGFIPSKMTISVGESVVWVNNDKTVHTITSDNGTYLRSNNLLPGETYERQFNSKGAYAYHSIFQITHRAAVYVE